MLEKRNVLIILEIMRENVEEREKDKRNTEEQKNYYAGYKKAVKEAIRKITEMDEIWKGGRKANEKKI